MSMKTIAIAVALVFACVPSAAYGIGCELSTNENPPHTIDAYCGVYSFGDRTETYYSSRELYHYRTPEWTLDDEGFYRTEEGYYVVAASDMEQGTVFMGSKGLCQVLDCGCAYGITDYYVNW